jgi:hypothetical protein
MTIDPTNVSAGSSGLVARVKNILMSPREEWARIATESTGLSALLTGYVLPLAAIGAVASVIGSMLFLGMLFGPAGLVPAVIGALIGVGFTLLGVFLCGILINALASSFSSTPNQTRANQLAAYSSTASLIGSWGAIIPFLGWLFALAGGIYSIVLFYMGLTPMMNTPEDKRVLYTIVLALIAIVAYWIIGMVVAMMLISFGLGVGGAMSRGFSFNQAPSHEQSEVTLPGGGTVDLDALQKQAEAMQSGEGVAAAVDPMQLQQQLPQSLPGGFALASVSSSAAMGGSQAEGVYQNGDAQLRVNIVHMGAMGALAGMAAGMNVQENRQDADGYSRSQTIDGRIYSEEVSNSSRSASYGVIGRGVAVTADGSNGVTLDQARAAVETIGVQRLEREFGA